MVKGRISDVEKGYIAKMYSHGLEVDKIADVLGRSTESIYAHIPKSNKTQFAGRDGIKVMTENESYRSDQNKKSRDKVNKKHSENIHKINE